MYQLLTPEDANPSGPKSTRLIHQPVHQQLMSHQQVFPGTSFPFFHGLVNGKSN
jgi:hypothetical protein